MAATMVGSNNQNVTVNHVNTTSLKEGTAGRFDECDEQYIECRVQKYLFHIFGPILLLLSIIGCVFGIAVMRRPAMRKSSSSLIIICLAIFDTAAVLTGLIRHIILKTSGTDVRQLSEGSCKLQRFMLYWSLDTAAWLLVVISFDRFSALYKFKSKFISWISSEAGLKILILVVAFVQGLFNIQVLILRGRQINDVGNHTIIIECGYTSPASKEYWTNTYNLLSLFDYCVIPSILMLTFNVATIAKLHIKTRNLKRGVNKTTRWQSVNIATSITKMLLTVTLYFVVVTFPSTIFSYHTDKLFFSSKIKAERHAKLELADAVCTLLLYMNHSANFFLYCISSKRYRKELCAMLKCCRKSTGEVSINSTCANNLHQGQSMLNYTCSSKQSKDTLNTSTE